MRMRARLLAGPMAFTCAVLAADPTQKSDPVASWSQIDGPTAGQVIQGEIHRSDTESTGEENRIVFVPFDAQSPSMEEIRARLADPEQREAMRAEQRASFERSNPDAREELKLDATTHEALVDLLADQYVESLDAMFGERRRDTMPSMQDMARAENRKLDQLREVLGDEGLERYQEYVATGYERSQVRDMDALLGAADKLSPEQKPRLVQLFREKNRMGIPPPAPSRMSTLFRSADPESPGFREQLQRESQLATIESNQQVLRLRETSNRWMTGRASGFLTAAQRAALAESLDADMARQRKWIEKARADAGLDRAIPEGQDEAGAPPRRPVAGEVTLDLLVRVDGGEPVHVTHTGPNGEPLKFKATEGLFAEAEWTLFDDDWIDVRLNFFEEGPNGLRRLQGGSGFGTMGRASGNVMSGDFGAHGSSSTIVMGRKAYSVELSASAVAR